MNVLERDQRQLFWALKINMGNVIRKGITMSWLVQVPRHGGTILLAYPPNRPGNNACAMFCRSIKIFDLMRVTIRGLMDSSLKPVYYSVETNVQKERGSPTSCDNVHANLTNDQAAALINTL